MNIFINVIAQERLRRLQGDLTSTEDQITLATDELQKLVNAQPLGRHLTEDDKQEIRDLLASKMNRVGDMVMIWKKLLWYYILF